MNTDITYCKAQDCAMKFTCKRHINEWDMKENELYWIGDFKHDTNGCGMYWKEGE